jgi:hypothetical protein
MKRLITAVSFAVLAVPAFAGDPYDQSLVDRALPQIEDNASAGATRVIPAERMPYDQNLVDRALPQFEQKAPARTPRSGPERGLPYDQVEIDRALPVL